MANELIESPVMKWKPKYDGHFDGFYRSEVVANETAGMTEFWSQVDKALTEGKAVRFVVHVSDE